MSGSEQFLGRQLAEQAQQLALLVDKMGEMVEKQDEIIPKFAISSDNIQLTKDLGSKSVNTTNKYFVIPQINGEIKITFQGNFGYGLELKKNGVLVGSGTGDSNNTTFIIKVLENDELSFDTGVSGSSTINIVKVYYDLVSRPTIVL